MFVEGGIYHVYNRCARGAEIFREGDEADRFFGLLRKVRDRDGLAPAVMPAMAVGFISEGRPELRRCLVGSARG